MSRLPGTALRDAAKSIPFTWLRDRRWFSSKGRTLRSLEVVDWGELPLEAPSILAIVRARYTTGRDEQYLLPLVASPEATPAGVRTPAAMVLAHEGQAWHVHDAFQFEGFQRLLMVKLLAGAELPLSGGKLLFVPEEALRKTPPPLEKIKLITAEQSNSSIIYDGRAILKCFRRVVAGVNPDVEVSRFLTTRAGFTSTPKMLGAITYTTRDGVEHSLGLLQSFVANKGDAWEHTLNELKGFFAQVQKAGAVENTLEAARKFAAPQLPEIHRLGALTGELHRALASDPKDPDFGPRPLGPEMVEKWQASIRKEAEAMLADLAQRLPHLPPEQTDLVKSLIDAKARVEARIDSLATLGKAGVQTSRFHGDYHLGQVLVVEDGFMILDFEGEPLRTLEERRAHGTPLKDVAGMLRSFGYAAHAARIAVEASGAGEWALPISEWAESWEECAREAFMDGYLEVARGAPFLPKDDEVLHCAIAALELEKALYELNYELNNRPTWLSIPLRGIQRTIAR